MSVIHQPVWPVADDNHPTPTSLSQRDVESDINSLFLPFRSKLHRGVVPPSPLPLPSLRTASHLAFATHQLQPLPAGYVFFDATRPWLIYWSTHAMYLLSRPLPAAERLRAVSTLLKCQHPTLGGFAGADGQLPHLMGTYAAVCALVINGAPGPAPTAEDIEKGDKGPEETGRGGWDDINRPALYRFLLSMKQPDGSFTVNMGGEVDVRATYCVVSIALMLGIGTPELFKGVGDFVASCQTYEGGLGAASHPPYAFGEDGRPGLRGDEGLPRPPLGEAHGGYAFCAAASHLALSLLPRETAEGFVGPFFNDDGASSSNAASHRRWDAAHSLASTRLDLDALLRWSASMQGLSIEGGGFRGRTNKLVDGCYGWFAGGGLFGTLQTLVEMREGEWWEEGDGLGLGGEQAAAVEGKEGSAGEWESEDEEHVVTPDGYLFDCLALQEYVLVAAQPEGSMDGGSGTGKIKAGGLRDKPGSRPDIYHTCYNLSGLSAAQHRVRLCAGTREALEGMWKKPSLSTGQEEPVVAYEREELQAFRRKCYAASLGWTVEADKMAVVGDQKENLVLPTHPIFNVPFPRLKAAMDWSYGQM